MKTLTIKELTDRVGNGLTPRMVRHYHQLGLLPPPVRSNANYRLYTQEDVAAAANCSSEAAGISVVSHPQVTAG